MESFQPRIYSNCGGKADVTDVGLPRRIFKPSGAFPSPGWQVRAGTLLQLFARMEVLIATPPNAGPFDLAPEYRRYYLHAWRRAGF
jgi:hypothetical protein